MELSQALIQQVRQGQVVLFFGAGASIGATTPAGKSPPLGNSLRDMIAKEFLGMDAKEAQQHRLSWIAQLAISASDLFRIQDFVADQFRDLRPAGFHELIPTFRWRGLATTNYDRLIEIAYETADSPTQLIVPFLHNNDRVDQKIRDGNVALLKLHGCVTRTHDDSIPLILSNDQYATYRENRSRLFNMLEEWGTENTLVFIGHRLQDPNLTTILLDLTRQLPSRPRYYLVRPGVAKVEYDLWAGKQITVLDGSFKDFLETLDQAIDPQLRPLAARLSTDHPIRRRFVVKDRPSQALLEFLESDAEYVHEGISINQGVPTNFYKGFGLGWYPIAEGLDVKRTLVDKILYDVVLRTEEDRPSLVELYVVKAEAGAGKSVLLRHIAWDAATQAGALCLRSLGTTPFSFEALKELSNATNERIFFFIDNASDHVHLIRDVLDFARRRAIPLTIITAERINEWNVSCETLDEYLTDDYPLRYLSETEIGRLVDLLEKHDSLGPNLSKKSREERIEEFRKRAGRQLLVALHEATHGRPFEEILLDEYKEIAPPEAQRLYLSVCVLNRLKVPVRAGFISRVHNIAFEDFRSRLFKPLEHVVIVTELPWGDYGYQTRHPEIAQIVFEQVLTNITDRFNEYVRLIKSLNPMYSVDLEALRGLIRAKWVHELFPSHEDAAALYNIAEEIIGKDPYFLQQKANYERIRPSGNLRLAETLLERAREIAPHNETIIHTLAEVFRARAEIAEQPLERIRLRGRAKALLQLISRESPTVHYKEVTQLKLVVDNVEDLLRRPETTDRDIDEAIRQADQVFESARQRFPGDGYILGQEAGFAQLLQHHERSISVLEHAREANPRDPFIVSRLAAMLSRRGDGLKASQYLEEALDSNRSNKRLNFQYAELLRQNGTATGDELIYFYRRAFTKWDTNYESQFWFARFAFESNDTDLAREYREAFRHLRSAPISHEQRINLRDAMGGLLTPKDYSGTVLRLEVSYGFAEVDGRGDQLFFHQKDVLDGVWDHLSTGTRIVFSVGFTLGGPKAFNLRLEGRTA